MTFPTSSDQCDCFVVHQDAVNRVVEKMLSQEQVEDLAFFYKVFADVTRLKILHALSLEELCVCDLAAVLGMNQSAVSHQLKMLRSARVVKTRRSGKMVYYSMDDAHIHRIFQEGKAHLSHMDPWTTSKGEKSNGRENL